MFQNGAKIFQNGAKMFQNGGLQVSLTLALALALSLALALALTLALALALALPLALPLALGFLFDDSCTKTLHLLSWSQDGAKMPQDVTSKALNWLQAPKFKGGAAVTSP